MVVSYAYCSRTILVFCVLHDHLVFICSCTASLCTIHFFWYNTYFGVCNVSNKMHHIFYICTEFESKIKRMCTVVNYASSQARSSIHYTTRCHLHRTLQLAKGKFVIFTFLVCRRSSKPTYDCLIFFKFQNFGIFFFQVCRSNIIPLKVVEFGNYFYSCDIIKMLSVATRNLMDVIRNQEFLNIFFANTVATFLLNEEVDSFLSLI